MSSEHHINEFLTAMSIKPSEKNIKIMQDVVSTMLVLNKKYPNRLPAPFGDYKMKVTNVGTLPRWRVKHDDLLNEWYTQEKMCKKYNGSASLYIEITKEDMAMEVGVNITYDRLIKGGVMTISNIDGSLYVHDECAPDVPLAELLKAIVAYCRAHTFMGNVSPDEYDMEGDLDKYLPSSSSSPKRQRSE